MEKMTTFIFALFAHVCVHYLIRRNKMRSSFDPTDSQGTIRKKSFMKDNSYHTIQVPQIRDQMFGPDIHLFTLKC